MQKLTASGYAGKVMSVTRCQCCSIWVPAMSQLRQIMREGLVQKLPIRQALEAKFDAGLRYAHNVLLLLVTLPSLQR